MGAIRRMRARVMAVAVVATLSLLGSAVLASPAMAGGVDTGNGQFSAGVYNVTPYPWTLVSTNAPTACDTGPCFVQPPAGTLQPGDATVYKIAPNVHDFPVFGDLFSTKLGYDAYFTYRVDVLGGPPEYVTITVSQCYCTGVYGTSQPAQRQWFTTTPPVAGYDPGYTADTPPAPQISDGQLAYQEGAPYPWDLTYTLTGDHTVDASSSLGQALANVLTGLCSGQTNTTCSFTQNGPLTWSVGTPVNAGLAYNCTSDTPTGGSIRGSADSSGNGEEPNYFLLEYLEEQSASLTVGGSISGGVETNIFDTISSKITIKLEAEHDWQETKTYTRETKVFIPDNDVSRIWVAPTVGKVTGTLVMSNGSSTFTVTNFSETRSGVSRNDQTPAYDVLTKTEPMTASEHAQFCPPGTPKGLGSARSTAAAPSRLVPGRGVAKVGLGQSQAQVLHTLGRPAAKVFSMRRCTGLQSGCDAVPAAGGIWRYRGLSVRFAADRHVAGLTYRGDRRTSTGVGVDSRLTAFRAAYRDASCTSALAGKRYVKRVFCTVTGDDGGAAVQTVFRFIRSHDRYDCDKITIALVEPGRKADA